MKTLPIGDFAVDSFQQVKLKPKGEAKWGRLNNAHRGEVVSNNLANATPWAVSLHQAFLTPLKILIKEDTAEESSVVRIE